MTPRFEGFGLHTGERVAIELVAEPGPVRLRQRDVTIPIDELVHDGARSSTTARSADGRLEVGTVEHLYAALAGAGIREGLVIAVDGPEVPLVDGGARAFLDALERLDLPRGTPRWVVEREATIDVGEASYRFTPSPSPSSSPSLPPFIDLAVAIDFGDPRLAPDARWSGDLLDFRERIAPARTFGFVRQLASFEAQGLARRVAPEAAVLVTEDAILFAGRPFSADEPARHKLLDLAGDLYAHGGPPLGSVVAYRPGHAATHEVMKRVRERGIVRVAQVTWV